MAFGETESPGAVGGGAGSRGLMGGLGPVDLKWAVRRRLSCGGHGSIDSRDPYMRAQKTESFGAITGEVRGLPRMVALRTQFQ